jgi:hypothetical protein
MNGSARKNSNRDHLHDVEVIGRVWCMLTLISTYLSGMAEFRSNPQSQGKGESEVSHHARINCG